jgi:EAL domain-containing protein (putative c-di-GMP-specific phosphodiesterase class I)
MLAAKRGSDVLTPFPRMEDPAPRTRRETTATPQAQVSLDTSFSEEIPQQDDQTSCDALAELLTNQDLDIEFQPILSLRHQSVVGIEALARPRTMGLVQMFLEAETTGRMLELDRLCRLKALESYSRLRFAEGCRPLLFLNFESSVIDRGVLGSGWLLERVKASGLEPSDVVIEVNESRVHDLESLRDFVDTYRRHGFLIALDDLGAGDSNLPRIAQLRPHIIKLDRHLVAHVDRDFFKQETIKSLVNLSRSIGCMVLAEGVETHAEVDTCASLGAELLQGFFFARARKAEQLDLPSLLEPLTQATRRQRIHATDSLKARRQQSLDLQRLAQQGCAGLQKAKRQDFDAALWELVANNTGIEAAYLLDDQGIQVSETHMASDVTVLPSVPSRRSASKVAGASPGLNPLWPSS